MAHTCHATDCHIKVPPEMFLCKNHWFLLPKVMRDMIWSTYRPGQCDDKNPSLEYCIAAKNAVMYIANEECIRPDTRLYDFFIARKME